MWNAVRLTFRERVSNLGRRGPSVALGVVLLAGVACGPGVVVAPGPGSGQGQVEEKRLLNNDRVEVFEFVFPPGFRGDEHEAPVNEFAYVIDGEFAVVTKGRGKRVVHRGEIEWASRGDAHYSLNESNNPARV